MECKWNISVSTDTVLYAETQCGGSLQLLRSELWVYEYCPCCGKERKKEDEN